MLRLLNYILVFILIAASSPDEVLGFCVENCSDSMSQYEITSKATLLESKQSQKNSKAQHEHDCQCPVHAHHCCSHISLISFSNPSTMSIDLLTQKINYFYLDPFFSEPALDGLFRPPIS